MKIIWPIMLIFILAFTLPVSAAVNFVAIPSTGVAPLTVSFIDQSDIANTWRWNFGDGDVQSINGGSGSTSHTYSNPGIYTVSMTVNGVSTVSYQIIVTSPTTVPTTVPTSQPTTISTTIPTSEPTAEVTTVATTIITTVSTTIQTPEVTTEPTTVPTTEIPTIEPTLTTEQTTAIITETPSISPTTEIITEVPTTEPTSGITTVITTQRGSPQTEEETQPEIEPDTPTEVPTATQTPEPAIPIIYDDKSLEFTLPYLKDASGKPIIVKIYLGDFIYIIRRN